MWGLLDYGFKAVVSPRFGDIFRTNCTKAGLLPVEVPAEVGRALLEAIQADPTLVITVDVAGRTLSAPGAGIETTFPLDDFTQMRFLEGLDDIGYHPAERGGHHRLRGRPPRPLGPRRGRPPSTTR